MREGHSFHEVHRAPRNYHLFLFADAVLFSIVFFKGVESVLLISDGVYGPVRGIAYALFWALCLVGLAALNERFQPESRGRKRHVLLAVEITGFLLVLYGMYRFAATPPRKGIDTLWIANQWRMLPWNWMLMAKLSPKWAAIAVLGAAALMRVLGTFAKRGTAAFLTLLVLVHFFFALAHFPYGEKVLTYIGAFGGPLMLAMAAALLGMPRLFSRLIFGSALGLILFWSYCGFIPKQPPSDFAHLPGVQRLYPKHGHKPEFPVAFMRDLELDPVHNALFTTYGPACGIVKISLPSGRATVREELGLIRFMRHVPKENFIYGTNWDLTELTTISKEPFKIVRSQNLFKGDVLALWEHELDGANHFVGTTEYAGLAKYTRSRPGGPLEKKAFLNFHKLGLIKFKSGAFGMARNPIDRSLYIEIGMLDTSDRYMVLKINPDTMKIEKTGLLPEGGLELILIPEHNALIASGFFSDNFYELDASTLKLRRSFKGPVNSRNVVYDPRRDLLYALSFLGGRLYIIRYSDMDTLFHIPVGKRANALTLWPEKDVLFLGSSEGVYRINLKQFTDTALTELKKEGRLDK